MNTARNVPIKESPATLNDILSVQKPLTDLLQHEADLMDAMELGKVAELQERKLKLTAMLERYMRYFKQHPDMLAGASPAEKVELKTAADRFADVMKRNYDTLLVARAVNNTVVKCVTQMVTRKQQNPVYNSMGTAKQHYRPIPISVTLNETV